MKRHVFFLALTLVLVLCSNAQAPTFQWAFQTKTLANPDPAKGFNTQFIVADTVANCLYVAGAVNTDINFGPAELEGGNAGQANMFLAKMDMNGNVTWARLFPELYDTYVTGLAVDGSGNIIASGYSVSDTVKFGSKFLINPDPDNNAHSIGFVVKFDASGNALWLKGNSAGGVRCMGVAADRLGNIAVTGTVDDPNGTFFGNTTVYNAFFMKLDANGNSTWFKQVAASGIAGACEGLSVTFDKNNDVIACGVYIYNVTLGTIQLTCSNNNYYDRFTTKLNGSTGAYTWAVGTGLGSGADGNYMISADHLGNYLLSGMEELSSGKPAYFIEKCDGSGNTLWHHYYLSTTALPSDIVYGIRADAKGNGYMVVTINEPTAFGSITITPASPTFSNSTIVAVAVKFDQNGNVVWAKADQDKAVLNFCFGQAITSDKNGNCYMSGYFNSTCDFDNNHLSADGSNYELFVTKLASGVQGISKNSAFNDLEIFPNPSTDRIVIQGLTSAVKVSIVDVSGREVYNGVVTEDAQEITLANLVPGIYMVNVSNDRGSARYKVVKE